MESVQQPNKPPADDKAKQLKESLEKMSYDEACKWRKYSAFLAAGLLIVIGVFSILSISEAGGLRAIIMTLYLIVIAVVMILVELG